MLKAGTCLSFVCGITLFGSLFILPLFLQRLRGCSVLDSSLIQMPRMLIMFVVTPIAGHLYNYVDGRLLISAGIAMMLGYFDLVRLTLEVGQPKLVCHQERRRTIRPKCSAAWSIVTQP